MIVRNAKHRVAALILPGRDDPVLVRRHHDVQHVRDRDSVAALGLNEQVRFGHETLQRPLGALVAGPIGLVGEQEAGVAQVAVEPPARCSALEMWVPCWPKKAAIIPGHVGHAAPPVMGSQDSTIHDTNREGTMAGSDVQTNDHVTEVDHERTESYVVFRLGGESYALEVMRVQEVLDVTALTRVPGGPRSLRGLLQPAGPRRPGLRPPGPLRAADETPGRAPSVLMVEPDAGEPPVTGLLVDRVSDVLEFAPEDVQPPPQLGLGAAAVRPRPDPPPGRFPPGTRPGPGLRRRCSTDPSTRRPDVPRRRHPEADPPPSSRALVGADFRADRGVPARGPGRHHLEPHRLGLSGRGSRPGSGLGASPASPGSTTAPARPARRPGMQLLIDLSTVNHTAFFREPGHFSPWPTAWPGCSRRAPRRRAGPRSGRRAARPARSRTAWRWSWPRSCPASRRRVEIWASDLSLEMLRSAARGHLRGPRLAGGLPRPAPPVLPPGPGARQGSYRVVPEIRDS